MKCYKCTWQNCHLRTKLTFFSPLCSKYQWEYACNNLQRITLSASQCNKMHPWFWLSFFVVLKWQCILYMRINSHSHMLFSDTFFMWCWSFSRGLLLQCFLMVRFKCTCHPSPYLTNTTGKFFIFILSPIKLEIILQKNTPALFLIRQKQRGNPHLWLFLIFFISLKSRRCSDALYIKCLYVFVKDANNTSGFL